jgi:hypothetical protein
MLFTQEYHVQRVVEALFFSRRRYLKKAKKESSPGGPDSKSKSGR